MRMRAEAAAGLDPLLEDDRRRATERAAVFWTVTTALCLVLVATHPPTVRLGAAAGWTVAALCTLVTVLHVVGLRRAGAGVSERSILAGAVFSALAIGLVEWLAGGARAPITLIFSFSVFGAAAVLPRRHLAFYLVVVTLVTAAPLLYDPGQPDVGALVVFVAFLWLEAAYLFDYRERLRERSRALYEAERLAAAQARTDALTGMGNRRALEGTLVDWFAARGEDDRLTVVYLDLNGFKAYNDRFGHTSGDALLRRLGHALAAVLEPGDRAYRLGGDEFCVLIEGDVAPEAERIGHIVAALTEHGPGFSIDASRGVVAIPAEAGDPDAALRLADARMYRDKRAGRVSPAREMSELLLRVVAEREPDLHDHASDVVALARAVALRLGVTGEELDVTIRAAEQHDVGKLAVPDAILRKPGPLDEGEWALMREHTIAGERILAGARSLRDVSRLVRSSHERWDGEGYPDGLAGEDIPLGARIIAACDAFAAMRTDRPYRRAMTEAEAVAEVERCAGTQFDPDVAAALRAEVAGGRAAAMTPA